LESGALFFKKVLPSLGPKAERLHKACSLDDAWLQIISAGLGSKACGYPFNCKDSPCGVAHVSKLQTHDCSVCWKAIQEAVASLSKGEAPTNVVVAVGDVNPKPEMLKKKKILEGRTRMVICANFVQVLIQVMLSGGFSSVKDSCYDGWNRIGMCVARGGLQRIRRKLAPLKFKRMMDYKQFDLTQISEIQVACLDSMADVYGIDIKDDVTSNLFDFVKNSLSGPKQWRVDDGVYECREANFNASGNRWTGELNGFYNVCVTLRSWFEKVPSDQEFFQWFYSSGTYMNKYGDDTLDGSTVPFPSKEDTVRRLQSCGIKISVEDIVDSPSIVGLSFLGFTFDDSLCGVSFDRWPKSVMNILYMPNDEVQLFCAVQSMRLNFAGNDVAQAVAKKLQSVIKIPDGQIPFTDTFVHHFWTGREDLKCNVQAEMSGKLLYEDVYDDDFRPIPATVRRTEPAQSPLPIIWGDKKVDLGSGELPTSGGVPCDAKLVAAPQKSCTIVVPAKELTVRSKNSVKRAAWKKRAKARILEEIRGKTFDSNAVSKSQKVEEENQVTRSEENVSSAKVTSVEPTQKVGSDRSEGS